MDVFLLRDTFILTLFAKLVFNFKCCPNSNYRYGSLFNVKFKFSPNTKVLRLNLR